MELISDQFAIWLKEIKNFLVDNKSHKLFHLERKFSVCFMIGLGQLRIAGSYCQRVMDGWGMKN